MLSKKQSIIYITKSKIKLVNVTIDKKPKEEVIDEALWMSDSLENIFLKFKKNVKGRARILLSEDFVYVVTLSFPVGTFVNREKVIEKAQELIPENMAETVWDYKVTTPSTMQIVAVVPSLSEKLREAIVKTRFPIEEIVPLSYVLASFSKSLDIPLLFVYKDEEILLVLAQRGTVITTKRILNANIDKNVINQFIAFAKSQFSKEPKMLIFCGDTSNIDTKQFENKDLKVEILDISPILSLSSKEELSGKDKDVLNITLMTMLRNNHAAILTANKKSSHSKTYIIAILTIVSFLGIIGGLFAYRNMFLKKTESPKASPVPTKLPSPTASVSTTPSQTQSTPSAEIDLSLYTVSVLNGSGIEGEATRFSDILKENGYNVVNIGNADSATYEKTEVRHKKDVPNDVILGLDKIINSLYDFSISANLETDSESDIIIIIGSAVK